MGDDCAERQRTELAVLESIEHDVTVFSWREEPPNSFRVTICCPYKRPKAHVTATLLQESKQGIPLLWLPPITTEITLPPTYPTSNPPKCTLRCSWLSCEQLEKVADELNNQFHPDEEVLFTWMSFLKDELFSFLAIENEIKLDDLMPTNVKYMHSNNMNGAVSGDLIPVDELVNQLLQFDEFQSDREFKESVIDCPICLCSKQGTQCVKLDHCMHVFCGECLSGYFSEIITEGRVTTLHCPATESCESEISPHMVRANVPPDIYERYETLLLARYLDGLGMNVHCPRKVCQYPVNIDADMKDAVCPHCGFPFCVYCKLTAHGVMPCRTTDSELKEILARYENADEEQKQELERRFGVAKLKLGLEEAASASWMADNAKVCPHCTANCQRISGCNKMACYRCGGFFCYLCLAKLPPNNSSYDHFLPTSRSDCAGQLFRDLERNQYQNADDSDSDDEDDPFAHVY